MSYRFKAPRVRQRTGPMSDSPERPTKRLKVEQSKATASLLTTELWDAPSDITDDFQVAVELTSAHPWPTIAAEEIVPEEPVVNDHSPDITEALIRRGPAGLLEEPLGWPAQWAGTLPSPFTDPVSPFADCRPGTGKACFGMFELRKFILPPGGRLNGYVKVSRKRPRTNPASTARSHNPQALVTTNNLPAGSSISTDSGITSSSEMIHVGSYSQSPDWVDTWTTNISPEALLGALSSGSYSIDNQVSFQDERPLTLESTFWSSSPNFASSSFGELSMQLSPPPQLSPFSGASNHTDDTGKKLLDFYVNNFVPGRSILKNTNLWNEFAHLIDVPSIMSAIQCYMGLYIFDYTQSRNLFRRINRDFRRSESYFSTLLAKDSRNFKEDAEFMVLTIMLAMQDIILFERRRKLPEKPRWLEAFLYAEKVVELRVPSLSFRKAENVQLSALQNAHSVMVGRSLILAQTMDKLHLESFDVTKEGHRFQWLWFGNLNEIHGGCGFSKKLLHTIGRITWITAAVSDNPAFTVVGEHCLRMLEKLEQVNSESDFLLVPRGSQPIEAIRERRQGYIIKMPEEMTAVTAEAWRLAAIAYLQCRMMRLPRNHPDVVATVDDLAHCVRIMPTSGIVFTAQAPLLPVFFLGVLGTTPIHKRICKHWMDMVMTIPVRSSVPPIATALEHLWEWTAQDPRLNPATSDPFPTDISLRDPWWEYLVERVQEDEQEILCLT